MSQTQDLPRLSDAEIDARLATLNGWARDGDDLVTRLTFKGYARAVSAANLAAFVSDRTGHHADIRFGWGYCEVRFTTHDAGGITALDIDCAAKFNAALAAV